MEQRTNQTNVHIVHTYIMCIYVSACTQINSSNRAFHRVATDKRENIIKSACIFIVMNDTEDSWRACPLACV